MRTHNVAMVTAATAAIGSSMVAALMLWLIVTRPVDLVDAASSHVMLGLVQLAAATLRDILVHLLELL